MAYLSFVAISNITFGFDGSISAYTFSQAKQGTELDSCHCETDVPTNHELEVQHVLLPRAPVLHIELYIRLLCPTLEFCHPSQVTVMQLVCQIGLIEGHDKSHSSNLDPIFSHRNLVIVAPKIQDLTKC